VVRLPLNPGISRCPGEDGRRFGESVDGEPLCKVDGGHVLARGWAALAVGWIHQRR
jgi:hypothetical protein